MNVELRTEDEHLLQSLVDSGQFASLDDALHESIVALVHGSGPDAEWRRQLDESIAEGLADVEAGRGRPATEFLSELKARYGT